MPARRRSPGGYRIPLEHLRWYAAFHRKEDSVHIHMVVFSSNLKEGYLTKQGIRQVKSAFGRRIFRQDLLHIYEQKTEYRDALGRDAERTMAELIAQMETGQLQNENLEQPILELSRRLQNTKGKTVYGYLPPTAKALVDAIVDEPVSYTHLDSTGSQAKVGFHLESSSVCHRRPTRPFPSAKGWISSNS